MAKIQIVSTRHAPIAAILGEFYATAVVNIISWNLAYSMFPDIIFLEPRTTYRLKQPSDTFDAHFAKYAKRGWPLSILQRMDPTR